MAIRSLPLAAIIALYAAQPAAAETLASFKPDAAATTRPASLSLSLAAYREYVRGQADLLVGMTKVLAREIKAGELDAAQSAYAPAHRYLARLVPVVRMLGDAEKRLDARLGASPAPTLSGFHRIEYGLFAVRSTNDLSASADSLLNDVRSLRERLKPLALEPAVLLDNAARLVTDVAERGLDGGAERYARTDLWDLEANIDGVHEIMGFLRPELRKRAEVHFAKIGDSLARHKVGCGFKGYDELTLHDRTTLKQQVADLAAELSAIRGTLATN